MPDTASAGLCRNGGPAAGQGAIVSARSGSLGQVCRIIRSRAHRKKLLPAHLFADPAWDMLLELYKAELMSKNVSVTSVSIASNVPATTALRWIKALENEGLVRRTDDDFDGRRRFLSLTATALVAMDRFFEHLARD